MTARGWAEQPAMYVDTGVPAKWYMHDLRLDGVEGFLLESCPVHIRALIRVEMRSPLCAAATWLGVECVTFF